MVKQFLLASLLSVSVAMAGSHGGPGKEAPEALPNAFVVEGEPAIVVQHETAVRIGSELGKIVVNSTVRKVRAVADGHLEFPIRSAEEAKAIADFINDNRSFPMHVRGEQLTLGHEGNIEKSEPVLAAFVDKMRFVGKQMILDTRDLKVYVPSPGDPFIEIVHGGETERAPLWTLLQNIRLLLALDNMGALRQRINTAHASQQVLMKGLVEALKKTEPTYQEIVSAARRGKGPVKSAAAKAFVIVGLVPKGDPLDIALVLSEKLLDAPLDEVREAVDSALSIPLNKDISKVMEIFAPLLENL
ncbi:hypothetical protein K2X33_10880 [bacterium]|nr:hypothetical protein [bacterium]